MTLAESLKFVLGAVSKKDFVPALTNFRIEDGRIRSFNGQVAICAPIALNLCCLPKATDMYKAVTKCSENVAMSITPKGKLSIRSGKFRALVECLEPQPTPHVTPQGLRVEYDCTELVTMFERLFGIIGTDASRAWSNAILVEGNTCTTTNNVVMAQAWLCSAWPGPRMAIPKATIAHLIECKEAPVAIQYNDKSVTFHYEDGRWIYTSLGDSNWPDMDKIWAKCVPMNQCPAIPEDLWDALDKLEHFTDKLGKVYATPTGLSVSVGQEDETSYECVIAQDGVWCVDVLNKLNGIATHAHFDAWPAPCAFYGAGIRGAFVGMAK